MLDVVGLRSFFCFDLRTTYSHAGLLFLHACVSSILECFLYVLVSLFVSVTFGLAVDETHWSLELGVGFGVAMRFNYSLGS